jgi:DNA-binding CsgD family transcriptional regulator
LRGVRPPPVQTSWPRAVELLDRHAERRTLDGLIGALRSGESRALVVHGEPGTGKTALLNYLADHAPGCRVERIAGVQSEMELPFAGAHQLCAPLLDHLEDLPSPQREAIRTSFGLTEQPAPDSFLVGLGVLNLLSEAAQERPLVCLIDDEQWLDFASATILSFVARRLGSESLGLVFATVLPDHHLTGLPELPIGGLPAADAAALLDSVLPGKLDSRVRDRIVAETRANPLALLELTHGMTPAELAFGLELPGAAAPLTGAIEDSFRQRVDALPDEARRLLVLAAAEPTGDPVLLWQAAARLGLSPNAQQPAVEAGLANFGERVRFRHPLVRSAAYRSGSVKERQLAHQALADVTDPTLDPERRAWHQAQAVHGPDEDVAKELERGAELALARGCLAAAGAYLQRAVALSLDPAQRAERAIVAAQGKMRSGAFDAAVELLAMAQAGPLTDLQRARTDMVRAQLASITNRGGEAPSLLLKAAQRLESVDTKLARATYLDAFSAAIFAGRLAMPGGGVLDVARAAAAAPPPAGRTPEAPDLLLDSMAASYLDDYASGLPTLRQALANFGASMSSGEELRWIWLACMTAMRALDDKRWEAVSDRHLRLARETGALGELPLALNSRTFVLVLGGDLAAAATLAEETEAVTAAIRSNLAPYGELALVALRGERAAANELIKRTVDEVTQRGEGIGITIAEWAGAVVNNGLGDYDQALSAATRATEYEPDLRMLAWPLVELVEAGARAGNTEVAEAAYRRLSVMTSASGTEWGLGLEARSHALLDEGDTAEELYREAITRLGRTRQRTDLARAHLMYGEWLRRQRRRTDSREQLRIAQAMFETMRMEAFANRAASELRSSGETARKRTEGGNYTQLTPQEAQVARLARDGLTNPEIGTRLFISRHTVQYHLRKVFSKLGITSRAQLDRVLPQDATTARRSRSAG